MQVRATVSPSEMKEAARMLRPRYFWLRFFAANWYATVICLLIVGAAANAAIHHEQARWGSMAIAFAIGMFFIGLSWYRWNGRLTKKAQLTSSRAGTLSLDLDGVRTTLSNGTSTFIPWSNYDKWLEGQEIFLLQGNDANTVIPVDGTRDAIRGLLASKIS